MGGCAIATALYNGAKSVIPVDSVSTVLNWENKLTVLPPEKGMVKLPKVLYTAIHLLNIRGNLLQEKHWCLPLPMAPACFRWLLIKAPKKLLPVLSPIFHQFVIIFCK